MTEALSGGCQCGAVRFRVTGEIRHTSLCHCRMCQKAFAAPFGAFVSVPIAGMVWTRGQRKRFQSSNSVARGFCGDCGTPLTFEAAVGGKNIALATCAFDDPARLAPQRQSGLEARVAWMADVPGLPWPTAEDIAAAEAKYGPRTSYQHPDHDTDVWPPQA
ncbi:MAG TPA: GFA family protein [Caulobacteraceae bacterium]|jgi:hypothetical protein